MARSTGWSSAASPKATLAGLPPTCSTTCADGVGDGVDEGLADDEGAGGGVGAHTSPPQGSIMSVLPNQPGRSKRCSLSMVRIVPLRERMTRELVRADFAP